MLLPVRTMLVFALCLCLTTLLCRMPVSAEDAGEKGIATPQAGTLTVEDVRNALEKADDLSKTITVPENSHKEEGRKRAEESFGEYQSPEFQAKLRAEMDRIRKDVLGGKENTYYEGVPNGRGGLNDEKIYILVSSSVPVSTLRNYVRDIDYLGDPNIKLVMRGAVKGLTKMKETFEYMRNILLRDSACTEKCERYNAVVEIHPMLFRRYAIESVPAILYVRGNLTNDDITYGQRTGMPFFVLYGDAPLATAIDKFVEKTNSEPLKALQKKLRKVS